jgi:hypothetical protein
MQPSVVDKFANMQNAMFFSRLRLHSDGIIALHLHAGRHKWHDYP